MLIELNMKLIHCKLGFIALLYFSLTFVCCDSSRKYLIDDQKCKIPAYGAFNDETIKFWESQPYLPCTYKPLLTYVTKTDVNATLHIKEEVLPLYGTNITCCVSNVLRIVEEPYPDDNIWLTPCTDFVNNVTLTSDTVIVKCRNETAEIYQNAHSVILKTTKIVSKAKALSTPSRPLSVLFVVVDSVSRLNLIRTMPATRDYLIENEFIEMKGYNKVDDNTFPNFMAFLNGLTRPQMKRINCTGRHSGELNECPMIWYDFRDLGYATAYGEDWGPLGTFNYLLKGFSQPPTDYYFRPYVIASEMIGTYLLHNAPYCAGPETSGERQLNLALDFAKTFKDSPYFGVFWMNTFSHQAINTPSIFDDKIKTFFTTLKAEGILDDSLVIFLSDHGMRMDYPIRKTFSGWFEERLPMNLISVPKWFQEKYPEKYENLKSNSHKLTSTFDLYMTLQEILEISSSYRKSPSKACPNCMSFFENIPSRTCKEAGISQEWCTCQGFLEPLESSDVVVTKGIEFVLNYMRSKLISSNSTDLCHQLKLAKLVRAGSSQVSRPTNMNTLYLDFVTEPYAEYIVTLRYEERNELLYFEVLFHILRMDWNDDDCLKNSYKSYCICKEKNTTQIV